MEIVNRKARHEYNILENYTAGLVLQGSEVKSIKAGKANIGDAYCVITNGEVWMKNSHVSKYDSDKFTNHEEKRDRKLLLNKKEIRRLTSDVQNPGYTIIPLKMFIIKGKIKLEIGLCKGKKDYDKRESIKERDIKRNLAKEYKSR